MSYIIESEQVEAKATLDRHKHNYNYAEYLNNHERVSMIAEFIHCNQSYGDGEDYITHLNDVYMILRRFKIDDPDILLAAYLHDAVEDCNIKYKLIKKYFGERVEHLVYCVTDEVGKDNKDKKQKTYLKLAKEPDAITLKLADRIANMENAIKNKNRFVKKYQKEFENFKYNLYDGIHNLEMWDYLEKITKE